MKDECMSFLLYLKKSELRFILLYFFVDLIHKYVEFGIDVYCCIRNRCLLLLFLIICVIDDHHCCAQ